jgi:hypothetical protein
LGGFEGIVRQRYELCSFPDGIASSCLSSEQQQPKNRPKGDEDTPEDVAYLVERLGDIGVLFYVHLATCAVPIIRAIQVQRAPLNGYWKLNA